MPFNLNSRIKDVLNHPVGQDVLHKLMRHVGRKEAWVEGFVASRLPVSYLDNLAGKGFAESLVVLLNSQATQEVVHGGSVKPTWWKEAVFYRIYLPSFMDSDHDGVGDVLGIVQRLPYLSKLGVNTLWLSPFLGSEKEYDPAKGILDFSGEFGQTQDFETLLATAQAQDIRLVLEADISSTQDNHPWFLKALAGDEKYKNFYYIKQGSADKPPAGADRTEPAPWCWYQSAGVWVLCVLGSGRPDLNWGNPEVRQEICALLDGWKQMGVDGFALSHISFLSKETMPELGASFTEIFGFSKYTYGTQLHSYLEEIRQTLGEDTFIMGEILGIAPEMTKLFTAACNNELNMVWSNAHLMASGRRISDEGRIYLQDIKAYFLRWQDNSSDVWMPLFFSSHNLPRIVSRVGANAIYRSTVAKMLGTLMLTLRGTPIIYQGDELGLPNTRFLDIKDLKSNKSQQLYAEFSLNLDEHTAFEKILICTPDHSRTPMPWAAGYNAGFTGALPWIRIIDGADHLNATVQMQDKSSILNHYRKLVELRKKSEAMQYGAFNPVFAKNKAVFCFFRIIDGEKWYIETNITGREISRPGRILQSQRLMVSNYDTQSRNLRPYEANVYYCE